MAVVEGLESWELHFSVEVQSEKEANDIFGAIQDLMNEMGHTQWNGKMFRDLKIERALQVFRENKEEILASLPKEVVEAYYPDRKEERYLSIVPELEEEDGKAIDKNAS